MTERPLELTVTGTRHTTTPDGIDLVQMAAAVFVKAVEGAYNAGLERGVRMGARQAIYIMRGPLKPPRKP